MPDYFENYKWFRYVKIGLLKSVIIFQSFPPSGNNYYSCVFLQTFFLGIDTCLEMQF